MKAEREEIKLVPDDSFLLLVAFKFKVRNTNC